VVFLVTMRDILVMSAILEINKMRYKDLDEKVEYNVEQLLDIFGADNLKNRIESGDFYKVGRHFPTYRRVI